MLSTPARLGVAASLVFSSLVLPDAAALWPAAPGAPALAGSRDALAQVGGVARPGLVAELAGQRLRELGVPARDAYRLAADAVRVAASGEDAAAGLDLLAEEAAALCDAGKVAVRDVLARVEMLEALPVITTEAVARAYGVYADVAPAVELLSGTTSEEGLLGLPDAEDPASHAGGTCLGCPFYDFGPFTPTPTWTTQLSSIDTASDCTWFAFDVEAGATYEFQTCPPGGATFDTIIDLWTAACGYLDTDDEGCSPQSRLQWLSPFNGSVRLKVRAYGGQTGSFTLAWRRLCIGDPDCAAPDATLAAPTTSCQTVSANVSTCSGSRFYHVALMNGRTYTFTLCPATCPGAGASFDSSLQLSFGGTPVAASSSACGDDGEIVYTVPLAGDGTYCVEVRRESGATADFTLGYSVACVPASGMDILPVVGSTNEPDCSRDMTFTAGTTGTGDFTWTWNITPLNGQVADPTDGSGTTTDTDFSFTSSLVGSGDYLVTVTATNGCGTASDTVTFNLEDRGGPLLTPTAEAVACGTTFRPMAAPAPAPTEPVAPARPSAAEQLSSLTRDEMTALLAEPDPDVVQAALAEKLGLQAKNIVVMDRLTPGVVSPPGTMALGCATPCTGFGTLEAYHPYYDVAMNCDNGDYTARTGAGHSVTLSSGDNQNVIYGGTGLSPGTSNLAWYVHDSATFYQDPSGGSACLFDPPDTASEPNSTGIEGEWTVSPMAGVSLKLREEIVAFGDTEPNSGVRLTLGATNLASSTQAVTVGVRWQIDYENSWDDGPLFGNVHCEPFEVLDERGTEHEFSAAEIDDMDFYRIQNNEDPPIFGNFSSTTEIAGFPGTGKPDRLVYARWWAANGSPWNYSVLEGDPGPDSDSAVLFWYGYQAANGMVLAPGESFSRSVIIFTAGDNQDCGGFRPGECATEAVVQICPGDCARVGATAVDGCSVATVELVETSPGAPPCVGNPCVLSFPNTGEFVYTWRAVDEAGNEVMCTSTVIVDDGPGCNQPPSCAAGTGSSECRTAPIEGAQVDDLDGDAIAYAWTSDNPDVTVDPPSGIVGAGFGPRDLPATVAILADTVDPCGVTATLTLTVDDGRGGASSCTTTVTFNDVTPPEVTSAAGGGGGAVFCLWPPNHWYVPIPVSDLGVVAVDSCSATTWTVLGCVSDQPDDAPDRGASDEWNGDGKTENDCVMSSDGQTLYVRSERCGAGTAAQAGRHYGIAVVATDACGNVSAPTVVGAVYVPHDQSPAEDGCLNPTEIGTKDLP